MRRDGDAAQRSEDIKSLAPPPPDACIKFHDNAGGNNREATMKKEEAPVS